MAITLSTDGYCQLADVQALIQQFTIDANSSPSTTEAETWITEDFHVINATMRGSGYAAPVAQAGGSLKVSAGNITVKDAASIGATSINFNGTGLEGNVVSGDWFTLAGDNQRYSIIEENDAQDAEIGVAFVPDLELDAAAGTVAAFVANPGASAVLKKLNALSTVIRVYQGAYSATGDGAADAITPLVADRDLITKGITSGTYDFPSIAKPDGDRLHVSTLVRG